MTAEHSPRPALLRQAFAVSLRRGQRYIAQTTVQGSERTRVFVDLFERDRDTFSHTASAAADEFGVTFDVHSDGDYVIRVQPELDRDVRVTLTVRTEHTLTLPVNRRSHVAWLRRDAQVAYRIERLGRAERIIGGERVLLEIAVLKTRLVSVLMRFSEMNPRVVFARETRERATLVPHTYTNRMC